MGTELNFSGDVVLERADQMVRADELRYNQEQNRVVATGEVHYREQGLSIAADSAELDLEGDTGTLTNVDYRLAQRHARGNAARVEIEGSDLSRYEQVSYTTCAPGNRDWILKADKLKLDGSTFTHTAVFGDEWRMLEAQFLRFMAGVE